MIKKRELKTKVSSLSFRQKTYEDLQKLAYKNHTSFNNMCSIILEEYLKQHQSEIDAYDE